MLKKIGIIILKIIGLIWFGMGSLVAIITFTSNMDGYNWIGIIFLLMGSIGLLPMIIFRKRKKLIGYQAEQIHKTNPIIEIQKAETAIGYIETETIVSRTDGNPITGEEIPYLMQWGYEKALKKEGIKEIQHDFLNIPPNITISENTDMKLIEYEILKRLPRHPIEQLPGACYYFGKDFVIQKISEFKNLGYYEIAGGYDLLPLLKLPDLKNILKTYGLKVSGKKQELIDRVQENLSVSELSEYLPGREYPILTAKGKEIYNKLLLYKECMFNDLFDYMMESILIGDLNSAYIKMCEYESVQPFQRELQSSVSLDGNSSTPNSYWQKQIITGLGHGKYDSYSRLMDESDNKTISALAITFEMLGMGYNKIQNKIDRYCNIKNILYINKDDVINVIQKGLTISQAESYKVAGLEKYQILGTLDDKTCEECGKMDLEVFNISEAISGVNYPPFCDKCRCTTIAYFPPDEIDEMFNRTRTRIARNPATKKSYYVPADMTWTEWKKSLKES